MASRRFGKTRYGHVFSKGRNGGSDRGCDPIYSGPAYPGMFMGLAAGEKSSVPPVPSPAKYPPPTPLTTLGDLIKRKQALRYGCLPCLGNPRQVSPHEAAARFGYDMRLTEIKQVLRARCRSEDCRLEFEADATEWHPYRNK